MSNATVTSAWPSPFFFFLPSVGPIVGSSIWAARSAKQGLKFFFPEVPPPHTRVRATGNREFWMAGRGGGTVEKTSLHGCDVSRISVLLTIGGGNSFRERPRRTWS